MLVDDLRKALKASPHSMAELADKTGVHRVNLSQFRSGQRDTLPIDQLEKIARALGLSIIIKKSGK